MSDIKALAQQAERLMQNEDFRALLDEIEKDAVELFLRANGDTNTISRASDAVLAVRLVESALKTRIDAAKLEENRKAKHRAND